ncbi:MAG: glycoside hydrolase family 16 protein [Candidatus Nanopelagicales bacterium]
MRRLVTVFVVVAAVFSVMLLPSSASNKIQLVSAVKIPVSVGAGESVKVSPAILSKSPKRIYKWYVGGKLRKVTKKIRFKTSASDKGKSLRVKEIATFAGGVSMSSRSFSVRIGVIAVLSEPSIMFVDGTQKSATVVLPSFAPENAEVEIAWFRNGTQIDGANSISYSFTGADSGTVLTAKVSIAKSGYTSKTLTTSGLEVPTSFEVDSELLWQDEFNSDAGSFANSSNWVPQNGDGTAYGIPGWGNGEAQWYLWEQARHDGSGNLVISATRTGADQYDCYYAGNCQWISSKLVTLSKLHVKYGRISIRLKAASGIGTWPAFWTLGTNIGQVGWPKCGEIDVVELAGKNPRTVWGTPHGPVSGGPGNGGYFELSSPASQDFHVYTVDWYPDRIVWYVDETPYYTFRKSENINDWVFDDWQYLILNLAMGGGFGGPIDGSLNSAQLTVDWVRVYKINGFGSIQKP